MNQQSAGINKFQSGMLCQVKDCSRTACNTVYLHIRVHANHPPGICGPLLHVCQDHKDLKFEEVITKEGWDQICKALTDAGRAAPVREFSYLHIQTIN